MTCIVGLVEDGEVWIGGDSAGVSGWDLAVRRDPKVFRKGPFLFGFTSSFRMGQLLRFKFEPPAQPDGMSVEEYLATVFVDALRDCLKAGGYARKENEVEQAGTFLLGYAGRLFEIETDYQVAEHHAPFAAVGCGAAYALGAMHVSEYVSPRTRIMAALKAAEAWSAGVRAPFVIECLRA
jgi:ATP-dependent protease HslVU (ClpYQ) peptidase subunit